ncbi:hypothetical protein VPH35_020908 [Triticum aestivum]
MFQEALPKMKQVHEEAIKEVEKGVRNLVVTVNSMTEFSDLVMQDGASVVPGLAPTLPSSIGGSSNHRLPISSTPSPCLEGVPSGLLLEGPSKGGSFAPSSHPATATGALSQQGLSPASIAALHQAVLARVNRVGKDSIASEGLNPGQKGRGLVPASSALFSPCLGQEGWGVGAVEVSPVDAPVGEGSGTRMTPQGAPVFIFSAPKVVVQGNVKANWKRMAREGDRTQVQGHNSNRGDENTFGLGIGKKRGAPSYALHTGSDINFSFENASLESNDLFLTRDVNVCCKRVCGGRVEKVWGEDGVTSHVAKELEEKEEDYVEGRREFVGEKKGADSASAASGQEDRREK